MVIAYEECQGEQVVNCKGPQPVGGSSGWEGSFDSIGDPLDDRQRGYEEEQLEHASASRRQQRGNRCTGLKVPLAVLVRCPRFGNRIVTRQRTRHE